MDNGQILEGVPEEMDEEHYNKVWETLKKVEELSWAWVTTEDGGKLAINTKNVLAAELKPFYEEDPLELDGAL